MQNGAAVPFEANLDLFDAMSPCHNKSLLGEHLLHLRKRQISSRGVYSSAASFCVYVLPAGDFLGSGNSLVSRSVNSMLGNSPQPPRFFFSLRRIAMSRYFLFSRCVQGLIFCVSFN